MITADSICESVAAAKAALVAFKKARGHAPRDVGITENVDRGRKLEARLAQLKNQLVLILHAFGVTERPDYLVYTSASAVKKGVLGDVLEVDKMVIKNIDHLAALAKDTMKEIHRFERERGRAPRELTKPKNEDEEWEARVARNRKLVARLVKMLS